MKKTNPFEVLNDNMKFLVDYLKREIRCLGKMNGLSDSQISDMERDFIARLAFAAIIGDDGKEDDGKEDEKSDGLSDEVWNTLRFVKKKCNHECKNCIFASASGMMCALNTNPSDWEV